MPPAAGNYQANSPQIKPKISEDPAFFNVMPKVNSQAEFIDPKMKVAETGIPGEQKKSFFESIMKFKKYIFIVLGVIILGVVAYFAVGKLGGNNYQVDNLLVVQPATSTLKSLTNKPASGAATTTAASFTTPKEWRDKYFPACTDVKICGDDADPDQDGLTNAQEFKLGTDPNNSDSDQDGLADGDEVNVFGTDPLNSHTAKDPKYSDSDFIKGGFNVITNKKMSAAEIAVISGKMKQKGLHQPSITTLSGVLNSLYNFSVPASPSSATSTPSGIASSSNQSALDQSVEAKQSRDSQRSETIKNIEIALVKYNTDNKSYPQTQDFNVMYLAVKLYLKVATNPIDPINKPPFVYAYSSSADNSDFLLTFYSEVAGQLIKKTAANAIKDASAEQASIYDNQRETDLESIRTGLLLYSQNNVSGNQDYVFPTKAKYKTSIVPQYISEIPVDPKTGVEYVYEVSPTFNTFTLKTPLDNPPVGTTGYVCNQDSCQNY